MKFADIFTADKAEWKDWAKLSHEERLVISNNIWNHTYEVRKNARNNLRMAVKKCFGSPRKK